MSHKNNKNLTQQPKSKLKVTQKTKKKIQPDDPYNFRKLFYTSAELQRKYKVNCQRIDYLVKVSKLPSNVVLTDSTGRKYFVRKLIDIWATNTSGYLPYGVGNSFYTKAEIMRKYKISLRRLDRRIDSCTIPPQSILTDRNGRRYFLREVIDRLATETDTFKYPLQYDPNVTQEEKIKWKSKTPNNVEHVDNLELEPDAMKRYQELRKIKIQTSKPVFDITSELT
ncbi:MAG: hypothetical protein LBP59_11205 [Planctomycetaceae bacterium]|nr:hypothetical protein [Planctomycetaceae bacterium]